MDYDWCLMLFMVMQHLSHLSDDAAVAISNFIMKHRAVVRCDLVGNNDIIACGKKKKYDYGFH